MRAAPPCSLRLADGRAERVLLLVVHALAAAVPTVWLVLLADGAPATAVWSGLLAAALGVPVGHGSGRRCLLTAGPASRGLHWSGQAWYLIASRGDPPAPASALRSLSVSLDFGTWLLLRVRPARGADRWLVLRMAQGSVPAWAAMRVALRAHGEARAAQPADAGWVG